MIAILKFGAILTIIVSSINLYYKSQIYACATHDFLRMGGVVRTENKKDCGNPVNNHPKSRIAHSQNDAAQYVKFIHLSPKEFFCSGGILQIFFEGGGLYIFSIENTKSQIFWGDILLLQVGGRMPTGPAPEIKTDGELFLAHTKNDAESKKLENILMHVFYENFRNLDNQKKISGSLFIFSV